MGFGVRARARSSRATCSASCTCTCRRVLGRLPGLRASCSWRRIVYLARRRPGGDRLAARGRRGRRALHRRHHRHRLHLGQADLGHLVDVGRAADQRRGPLRACTSGYLLLRGMIDDRERARALRRRGRHRGRALNIPLVHFSVYWWRTLHQPPSILEAGARRPMPRDHRGRAARQLGGLHAPLRLLRRAGASACSRAEARRRSSLMPDNWGFVVAAYGARRRRAAGGYWRHLGAPRRRALDRAPAPREPAEPRMNRTARSSSSAALVIARRARATSIYAGVTQSVVYFVTPTRAAARRRSAGKAYRLGGMVEPGHAQVGAADARPRASPSRTARPRCPVRHQRHAARSLRRGRAARWSRARGARDGYFKATTILAKHSEEYKAPHDASQAGLPGAPQDAARQRGRADDPRDRLRRAPSSRSCSPSTAAWRPRVGRPRRAGPALVESAQHAALGVFAARHRVRCCCSSTRSSPSTSRSATSPPTPTSARRSTTASPRCGARSRARSSCGRGCSRSTR